MMGMISGSSVANVVTCGTFTIPLMKRVGYTAEKAGAIETAAGVDGQIMPPVMGAAAFLMAEYVGVSYAEICKNAALPAVISYIALFYIVHLEAVKAGIKGLPPRAGTSALGRLAGILMTLAGLVIFVECPLLRTWLDQGRLPAGVALDRARADRDRPISHCCASSPPSPISSSTIPTPTVIELPPLKETVLAGLHFLLPVVLLIWVLMVEHLSPGLSAFYATALLIVILLTQKPLLAMFRGEASPLARFRAGWNDLVDGLGTGARNMIGIAIATAAAGIVVGTVSITGFGLVMTDLVETISAGNIIGMLCLVAVICLILGMGMPTTASYIVVSTLMAPVVVELGAQSGLVVPLVAVHMFVFYFGLMADVTPPVGPRRVRRGGHFARRLSAHRLYRLLVFASAPGILPFMFIFNAELLLIGVELDRSPRAGRLRRGRGDAGVRRGDAGLVRHPQPLVRVGRDAAGDVHAAAPGLLDGFRVSEIRCRARRDKFMEFVASAPPNTGVRVRIEGTTVEGQGREEDRAAAARRRRPRGAAAQQVRPDDDGASGGDADRGGEPAQRGRSSRIRAGLRRHRDRDRGAAPGEGVAVRTGALRARRRRALAAAACFRARGERCNGRGLKRLCGRRRLGLQPIAGLEDPGDDREE